MTIRKARTEDICDIAELHVASIRQLGACHYTRDQIDAWASTRPAEHYQSRIETCFLYVAETNDQIVGFSQLDPRNAEIKAVYVHPDHARTGVGSQLLSALEEAARSSGIAALHLSSSLNAVSFYLSRGFSAVENVQHRLRSGTTLECVRMVKQLSQPTQSLLHGRLY